MKLKLLLTTCVLLFSQTLSFASFLKVGTGLVRINFEAKDSIIMKSIQPMVMTKSIFGDSESFISVPMQINGSSWVASVPMEQNNEIILLRAGSRNYPATNVIGLLDIDQTSPLEINVTVNDANSVSYKINKNSYLNNLWEKGNNASSASTLAQNIGIAIAEYDWYPCKLNSCVLAKSDFDDYQKVRKILDQAYFDNFQHAVTFEVPDSIKPWFVNNMKLGFTAKQKLAYRRTAKTFFEIENLPPFPDDYYQFLKDIDYSPEKLFNYEPVGFSTFLLSYNLLDRFPEIPAIGEMDGTKWRKIAKARLDKLGIDTNPTFMDFMLASSYMKQLRDNNPFSEIQIANVNSTFSDDLNKILLKHNTELANSLARTKIKLDISGETEFDVESYINENFEGKAIILDFWNTWCGPCISALKEIDDIKRTVNRDDVVFIYLSDTSSDSDAYNRIADRITGINIRLAKEAMEKLMDKYKFENIPFYLFISSDRKTITPLEGYPGSEKFSQMLIDL